MLRWKPSLAVIGAVVGAISAILTQLATQNPGDAAIIGLIALGITQGFDYYEKAEG